MKTLIYQVILIILPVSLSCTKNTAKMNTGKEKEAIKNEIVKEMDSLITGCESLDMNLAFKVFSKKPDFYMIASDGYYYNYNDFYMNNKNYFKTCSKFEINTIKLDIKVLSNDLVVVTWIYKAVATLKEGYRDIFDKAGATFLFKKNNNTWHVINYHESSLPPERVKLM